MKKSVTIPSSVEPFRIEGDWFDRALPANLVLEEYAYPDTSYSFVPCRSAQPVGFRLGFASGNYGHGIFQVGRNGVVDVGAFVVLQSTRICCQTSVKIGDHCMFSWGSVITDSWLPISTEPETLRRSLTTAASSPNRELAWPESRPVVIEQNVWVGFGAVIMPGVTIGRGAVIGCNTLINEDIAAYAVVVGNPARQVRLLEPTDNDEFRRDALSRFGIAPDRFGHT